ncbi:MAG: hypothetical protein V1901_03725 [Patescibacteria group bacterium]
MSEGLPLYDAFIRSLFETGEIKVPTTFHSRCNVIKTMFENDVTGIINTIIDYGINSASDTKYRIECPDESTEELLNAWLSKINLNINGVPSGIQELAKEYLRERWQGSSFCLLRVSNWEDIIVGSNKILAPTQLWYVNGGSIYVKRDEKNYVIGSDKYYLDKEFKNEVPKADENIIINKPYDRWYNQYATPYSIRKGIYKNYKAIEVLQQKGDETISKALPYLLMILKGDPELTKLGITNEPSDLTALQDAFETQMNKYKSTAGKTPSWVAPYDTKMNHVIPDLKTMLAEELFRQSYRALLAGLGFIEIMSENNRKASVINPKPFIAELNSGVSGVKSIILEVLKLVTNKNKIDHKKLFRADNELHIVNTALKINIEAILDQIRSSFVYGVTSIQTYQESLGLDSVTERERIIKEWKDGDRDIFYARMIQNQEANSNIGDNPTSVPITKKENEKQNEKTKNPKNMQKGVEELIVKCSKCEYEFGYLSVAEAGMGYVKCENCGASVTQTGNLEIARLPKEIEKIIDTEKVELQNKVVALEKESEIQKAKITEQQSLADQILKLQQVEIRGKQGKLLTRLLAQSEDNIEKAPYNKKSFPDYLKKYPSDAVDVWIETFNMSLSKGEEYAYAVAFTVMKKYLKKHYKKVDNKWEKK